MSSGGLFDFLSPHLPLPQPARLATSGPSPFELAAVIRDLSMRGSEMFPPLSRAARAGRGVAEGAGFVADIPENIGNLAVGFPSRLASGAGSLLTRGAGYLLDNPDRPPDGPVPTVAPTAETGGIPITSAHSTPAPDVATDHPMFDDKEWRELGQKSLAAHYKPPIRAIRMPNGRVLFTNQDQEGDTGGQEFASPAEGGREVRRQTMAQPGVIEAATTPRLDEASLPDRVPADPTGATMSALVRASTRAALNRGETGMGGPAPSGPTPGLSIMENPEYALEQKLKDAAGALSLATLGQQTELAKMPATERAAAESKDVALGNWMISKFGPALQHNLDVTQAAVAKVKADPRFASDPKALQVAIREIENSAEARQAVLTGMMQTIMKQRLYPQ